MIDTERDAMIGRTVQEHKALKQTLASLSAKADQMQQAVVQGLRLIKGETTGHAKDGALFIAEDPNSMRVSGCDWPSVEAIGELVTERSATEKRLDEITSQLRELGMGNYAR